MFRLEIKKTFVDDSQFKFPHGLPITDHEVAACAAMELIGNEDQECVVVFFLDAQNVVVGYSEVSRGGIDSCMVDMKVVLRAALVAPAIGGMIITHNHPSGSVEPSSTDDALTKRLYSACEAIGIRFLDHIIVSPKGYSYSYQETGRMRLIGLSKLSEEGA